jgi:hypothetical protein
MILIKVTEREGNHIIHYNINNFLKFPLMLESLKLNIKTK